MEDAKDRNALNAPRRPVRPPVFRHYVNRINRRIKPADKTTLMAPSVNVAEDLAAIREGRAARDGEYYIVNGRTRFHEEGGRVFPISGEGFIGPVGRGVLHALKAYARYNGINDRSEHEIDMNPAVSGSDREEARRIWNLREPR
jgi:hypothetical protein